MHPDLKVIYDFLLSETANRGLMGYDVDLRVEEDIYIKVYIRDEESINKRWTRPLMVVYFSAPGVLTVKFIAMVNIAKLSKEYKMLPLEGHSFKVDFLNSDDFESFVKKLI